MAPVVGSLRVRDCESQQWLRLSPRAEEIHEDVVLSLLFTEKKRRETERMLDMVVNSKEQGKLWMMATGWIW